MQELVSDDISTDKEKKTKIKDKLFSVASDPISSSIAFSGPWRVWFTSNSGHMGDTMFLY